MRDVQTYDALMMGLSERGIVLTRIVQEHWEVDEEKLRAQGEPDPEEYMDVLGSVSSGLANALLDRDGATPVAGVYRRYATQMLGPEKATMLADERLQEAQEAAASITDLHFTPVRHVRGGVVFSLAGWKQRMAERTIGAESAPGVDLYRTVLRAMQEEFQIRMRSGETPEEAAARGGQALAMLCGRLDFDSLFETGG